MSGTTSVLPVAGGTVTIDSSSAAGPVLADQLERLTGGAPIVIRGATRTVEGETVTVTGKASLLNVADMPVTATAQAGPDGTVLTVRFTLIAGQAGTSPWRFSSSFKGLPPFLAGSEPDRPPGQKQEAGEENLLDRLSLSDAAFVLTTAKTAVDPQTGAALEPGLNFVARSSITGLVGLLGSAPLGGAPGVLGGPIVVPKPTEKTLPIPQSPVPLLPWQLPKPAPGIHLRADLGIDQRLGGKLRLHDARLRIYSPTSREWAEANPTYGPLMGAALKLDVPSAGLSLDISAFGLASPESLMLYGIFEGATVRKFAQLVDLAGGGDLESFLPADVRDALKTLGKLKLEAVTLTLGKLLAVDGVGISVALPDINTAVLPQFTVHRLVAHFNVSQPFRQGRSVSVFLGGSVTFAGAPFDIGIQLPEAAATAVMSANATVPLRSLFKNFNLPAPPDLTVNEMQLGVTKSGSLTLAAAMASQPSWSLDIGPVGLKIEDVRVLLSRTPAGSSASISGGIRLDQGVEIAVNYDLPGDVLIRGELPDVKLSQLIKKLANQQIPLPAGLDFDFTDSSVIIEKQGPNLALTLATEVASLGTLAFSAKRDGSQWGYAIALSLRARLSSLPGLSALRAFEDVFNFQQLLLVVSSIADPDFKFADLARFNNPTIKAKSLTLPAQANGLRKGINLYATLGTGGSQAFQAVAKFLGLALDGSLGVTLQSGANPARDSKLIISISQRIQGMTLTGSFGGMIEGTQIGLFLTGQLATKIQGQAVIFSVGLVVVQNGVSIAGTMQGTIDIQIEGQKIFTLGNVAIEIGVSFQGVPSLGVAATVATNRFDSSVAVLFDSAAPAKSMLAGAVSNLDLQDIVETMAGSAAVPPELTEILGTVSLEGLTSFSLPESAAAALDNLDIGAVSQVFQTSGKTTIPGSSAQVLLVVKQKGSAWSLTDLTTMNHYQLRKDASGIQVAMHPQLYIAPQQTSIGQLVFPPGFHIEATVSFLTVRQKLKISVKPGQGVAIYQEISPIILLNRNFIAFTGHGGSGGPTLSLSTFSQPNQPRRELQPPHFFLSSKLSILGLAGSDALVSITTGGFHFSMTVTAAPGTQYSFKGRFDSLTNMTGSGTGTVGVNTTVDLRRLGNVKFDSDVSGAFELALKGSSATATFAGSFQFRNRTFRIAKFPLNVNAKPLADFASILAKKVEAEIREFLTDSRRWLEWTASGVTGELTEDQIGRALRSVHRLPPDTIAKQTKKILDYDASQVAQALKGARFAPSTATKALRSARFPADQVGRALKRNFDSSADDAARLLKGAGYGADKVAVALRAGFTRATGSAAKALKGAGFNAEQTAKALKGTFTNSPDTAARALKAAGFPAARRRR